MYTDIIELSHFYETPLGQMAKKAVWSALHGYFPAPKGKKILGLGYASPYLDFLHNQGAQIFNFMPAQQGVTWWPLDEPNRTVLVDETNLPLEDESVDYVLLIHSLDCTEQLPRLLREIWRVLVGHGQMILVVPNRRGFWARSEATPFGYGRSFSNTQLRLLVSKEHFVPSAPKRALFFPPTESPSLLSVAPYVDYLGKRFFPGLSGVYVMNAIKQLYSIKTQMQSSHKIKSLSPEPIVANLDQA